MSTEKIFNQIGQSEITDRQVSSLALRPNEPSQYGIGGLSGKQLQEHFDKLAKLVISRYNELARILSSNEVLEYLKLPETITNDNLSAISDLINKLVDADGDIVVETPEDDKIKGKIKNILSSQASNIIALQESVEVLNTATGKVPSTVEMHLNEDNYKLRVTIKNHLGDTISTSEIDFPIEESVVGMTFDEETKKLHLSLRNGTSLDVDISDIFTGVVTTLTDPSTNKALAASTGALIIQRIADAVKPVQEQIEILRQRVDSINVPIVHNSLYEHNVLLTASTSDGVYPQATLRLAILSEEAEEFSAGDVLAYLNYESNAGNVIKAYSGYVAYESVPGATDSKIIISHIANLRTISNTSMAIVYFDDDGFENELIVNTYATVIDNVRIVADVADDKFDYIAEPTTVVLEKTDETPYVQESDGYGFWYRVSDRYVPSHHLVGGVVKGSFYNVGTTDTTIPSYDIVHVIEQSDITILEGGYCVLIGGERVIHVVSDYEAYAASSRISLNANGVHFRYYDREFVAGHKTYSIDSLSYSAYAISDTALEQSSAFKKSIDEASKAHLKGWETYTESSAMRRGGILGVESTVHHAEESSLSSSNLTLTDADGCKTVYSRGNIYYESYNVDDAANPSKYSYQYPSKSGTFALLSDIEGGTGNAYFVGTLAEYEAQKDTIAVGTLIIITDEGDEESAILGQAILGKMILGKGA